MEWRKHLVHESITLLDAIQQLDRLPQDTILFLHNDLNELVGSLTDGDVRRGILKGVDLKSSAFQFCQQQPRYIRQHETSLTQIKEFRSQNLKIVPVLKSDSNEIVGLINFRITFSQLPIDVVIMAGGQGQRLRPLTLTTPKPLLHIGEKPIIEYTIDSLMYFGVKNIWLSVNYLAEQFETLCQKYEAQINLSLVREDRPLGTFGSVHLIQEFKNSTVLVCNSDLLTNIDYEAFYQDFEESGADFSVVCVPYDVEIPYAVLELDENRVQALKEKPTYTYYSNGGIYLMKRELLKLIPENEVFSAIDMMQLLMDKNYNVRSFYHNGYWLDIGKHEDFKKAQEDVKQLKLNEAKWS
jgi:dTDP-glucose pyrophosphorylase